MDAASQVEKKTDGCPDKKSNTYPTMYERVSNQLLSTKSSQFLRFFKILRLEIIYLYRGGEKLTGKTSIVDKVCESHCEKCKISSFLILEVKNFLSFLRKEENKQTW